MSAVDPSYVEQTKQQIRNLVAEIAQLSRQDMADGEFFGLFLNRVVDALAAAGGVVWMLNESGALELLHHINLRETRLLDNEEAMQRHGELLQKTMRSGEGALAPPHSGEGEDGGAANPTDYLVVLGPLKADQTPRGIVEIFQRPGAAPNLQRGYLRFVMQMCELASDFLKTRQLRQFSDRQSLWNQLESFTRVAHQSLDPRETAYTIANEGRRLIECDRVSVAIRRGRKCHIEAVSGQDTFDKRSNTVSLLSRLASAVVRTGDALWYSGSTADLAPQVEHAVQEYIDESHSKNVAVLPLKRPLPPGDEKPEGRAGEVIGALIVELIEDANAPEGMKRRIDVVCEHSSTALANALEHHNLFLMPVWKTLGKARWIVQARTLPKTIAVATAVAAAVAALCLIPMDFNLIGKGTLEPVERRDLFVEVEGVVHAVLVEEGQNVKRGQVLVELKNVDLEKNHTEVLGEYLSTQESLNAAEERFNQARSSKRGSGTNQPGESPEALAGDLNSLRVKLESLKDTLAILDAKREKLSLKSPIDGTVTTWDVRNRLQDQSVKGGQALMEIRNLDGDYELHVRMPEQDMGHVEQAINALGSDLAVTFRLAASPGKSFQGTVYEVEEAAHVEGEEGNVVRMFVQTETGKIDPAFRRPGAELTAKVYCGRRPVGYVWFHRVFEFVESRILFRLW